LASSTPASALTAIISQKLTAGCFWIHRFIESGLTSHA
jgi:hypothetical protein